LHEFNSSIRSDARARSRQLILFSLDGMPIFTCRRMQKATVSFFAIICLIVFGYMTYLREHLDSVAPRQPDPAAHRVYRYNVLGSDVVYVTRKEKLVFDFGLYVFLASMVVAGVLDQRWKVFRNPIEDMPKKFY
jgi:hypothetical protein